jgi:hypothetical protein
MKASASSKFGAIGWPFAPGTGFGNSLGGIINTGNAVCRGQNRNHMRQESQKVNDSKISDAKCYVTSPSINRYFFLVCGVKAAF